MEICYRCHSLLSDVTPSNLGDINFFECPLCKCHYTKTLDRGLHDRWLMPITLPLYGVILEANPVSRAKAEAHDFVIRDDYDLEILKRHIKEELENPKQKVSEIHRYVYPNEENLRGFLKVFVEELERY